MEVWIKKALEIGFTAAVPLKISSLKPMREVRTMCSEDKCQAYGKNWTCPPNCGSLEECAQEMAGYERGILLQTTGKMEKRIDRKAYMQTEERHMSFFRQFAEKIREEYPSALCLGAGGCRFCTKCAYPAPCRFPDQAYASMEGYGLFVTQVCRDNGLPYYYGEKTITYTACVLF